MIGYMRRNRLNHSCRTIQFSSRICIATVIAIPRFLFCGCIADFFGGIAEIAGAKAKVEGTREGEGGRAGRRVDRLITMAAGSSSNCSGTFAAKAGADGVEVPGHTCQLYKSLQMEHIASGSRR
jgi:hypothetical protein